MKNHISFGSTNLFDNVVKNINHLVKYNGLDENGKPTYIQRECPTIEVVGSEKIHGTNFTIGYNLIDGIWFQSRSSIITPQADNAGSAFWGEAKKDVLINIIEKLASNYNIDLKQNTILLCGEWAGQGVQSKSACDGLTKKYFLFQHFKVSPMDEDDKIKETYWEETKINDVWIDNIKNDIYNVMNFPTYKLNIDFNNPKLYVNKMIEIVNKIEENSPVGQFFGIQGNIGEGVVFSFKYKDQVFKWKVKGEKHSKTKVKQLKPVDNEKEQIKIDLANQVTPAWRLEQMFDLANDVINGGIPDVRNMGTFMKLLIGDVIKEESDKIVEKGLEIKDISSKISQIAKVWYFEQLVK